MRKEPINLMSHKNTKVSQIVWEVKWKIMRLKRLKKERVRDGEKRRKKKKKK